MSQIIGKDQETFGRRILGLISLGLFIIAILVILFLIAMLIISRAGLVSVSINAQMVLIASAALSLLAAVFGLFSMKTQPGFIGGMGGMALFFVIAIVLSLTVIAIVKTN